MANATANLDIGFVGPGGRHIFLPVAAAEEIFIGTLVSQLDADAQLVPGSTAASGPAVGMACSYADNSAGAAGDKEVDVWFDYIHIMANATAGDACSVNTPFGAPVYMFDDHTIADNSNAGARQRAGFFAGMEPDGRVRFYVGIGQSGSAAGTAPSEFEDGIQTDTVDELTVAAGVTVDGVVLKDSIVRAAGGLAIGASAPAASALLEIVSTTKGLLLPRMTTGERDAIGAPAQGLLIYNTSTGKLNIRVAAAWEAVTSA